MGSVNENFKASNDEAIVKRVQEGDVEAYNLLVIKYQHKIFQVIGKFVNNQADIADVAQEAFIKAYRAINSFRADSSFYTWLYRIAVNTAKTHLESNNKTRNHLDVDSPEFQSIDEQGVLASSDTPDRIDAMADLPTELSEAITLREVEGMSYEDMAVVLKVPIGTVRSRIFRARQFIEQRMTKFAK